MANKIVVVKTQGPQGPAGPAGPISSSGQFTSADDVTFGTGSFSSISSNYITASLIDVDASTIRIGGTPFSKTDLDNLREGKSIATGSKEGFTEYLEGSAFISSIDSGVLIRTAADRMSLNAGSGYILDLYRTKVTLSGSVDVTGSLKVLGNSPAIISDGDVFVGGNDNGLGGIIYYNSTTETPEEAGAARIHNYDNGNNHYTNIGQGTIVSASYGVAQGYITTAHEYAHSEGSGSVASGDYSHAEGGASTASGRGAHAEGSQTTASGDGSHAEGRETTASGLESHAEGRSTTAAGAQSHAEGYNTSATAQWAHAEGNSTSATDLAAHAEGAGSTASGRGSHAEGLNTLSGGQYTHTEGLATRAINTGSHAEGSGSHAVAQYSHAEGIGTVASGSGQHVQGYFNTQGNTTSLAIIGNGVDASNRSDLALFNVGGIVFNQPLSGSTISASGQLYAGIPEDTDPSNTSVVVINSSTGEFAYATSSFYYSSSVNLNEITFYQGDGTTETLTVDTGSGGGGSDDDWGISSDDLWVTSSRGVEITGSLTNGLNPVAGGNYSHAEGRQTQANGASSHAEGFNTKAIGNYAHAEGYQVSASGLQSHAEGNSTIASGESSHAEGSGSRATGIGAHAQGFETLAEGNYATTFGYRVTASGDYSIAAGQDNKAIGTYSYAAGNQATASAQSSTADGSTVSTHISASYSLVRGANNEAVGIGAVALGSGSKAGFYGGSPITHSGNYSLVSGNHVSSSRDYQSVFGEYNDESDNATFIVGAGTSTGRVNAIEVVADPSFIYLSGSLVISGSSVSIDIDALPTSDPNSSGQLYTTGSDYLGGPSGKKVLMIS